jgi:hypothetical protein
MNTLTGDDMRKQIGDMTMLLGFDWVRSTVLQDGRWSRLSEIPKRHLRANFASMVRDGHAELARQRQAAPAPCPSCGK